MYARFNLRRACLRLFAASALLLAAGSCRTRPFDVDDCVITIDTPLVQTSCRQEETSRKVDVLFLIDNSTSMDAMQEELRARFPLFLGVFRALEQSNASVDLHIGVTTSDYGAGRSGTGNCEPSPGGQRGILQGIGQFADPACRPPVGANYIQYSFGAGPQTNNLPPGQSLEQTFTCMATVGARGCGEEHQLEAVRAALAGDLPDNKDFLRDDALLVVVFVTNEDDCSAPPDTDLFDIGKYPQYGSNYSLRCTRFGVLCGDPPAQPPYDSSQGPLEMCFGAPNPGGKGPGKLYDIGRYVDLFSKPRAQGGLKVDPADVLLVGIDAPAKPFEIILADPSSGNDGKPFEECARLNENTNPLCMPELQHSCQSTQNGAFFGDPAVRLNEVISSTQNHAFASICDNDFTSALQNLGNLIVSQLGECCLPERLPPDPRTPDDPETFIASCQVQAVTRNADGSATVTEIPQCALGQGFPCFRVQKKMRCGGLSPQSFGVTIDWNGVAPPPHTTVKGACAGVPKS